MLEECKGWLLKSGMKLQSGRVIGKVPVEFSGADAQYAPAMRQTTGKRE
jgi:hypothetical protein